MVYTLDHTFFQKKGFGGKYCIKVELEFFSVIPIEEGKLEIQAKNPLGKGEDELKTQRCQRSYELNITKFFEQEYLSKKLATKVNR